MSKEIVTFKKSGFSTIEESKQILALGIPADSADCFYKRHLGQKDEYFEEPKVLPDGLTFSSYCGTENGVDEDVYVPCWTTGRLAHIYLLCDTYPYEDGQKYTCPPDIEWLISWIKCSQEDFEENYFDISKLYK